MGNTLVKSPQELALDNLRSAEKQCQRIIQAAPSPTPPGYVRVHFYSHLYKVYDKSPPDMTADLPLCRLGGLDLTLVKRCWGLETCMPVDPLRWKLFEPRHPNYLSPVALQILSCGQDGIKFIEPTVSQQTLVQRQIRQVLCDAASLIYLTICRVFEILIECLEADTPLPATCRRLRRKASRISATWTWDDVLNTIILFLWIVFAVAFFGGYVQLAPRERARHWVYTGSFSL